MLDVTRDIRSLSDFKRNTNTYLDQMRDSGQPIILTVNGKAEMVVHDATSWQKLADRVEELEAVEGIRRGRADVEAGRITSLEQFESEFRERHGLAGRPR